MAYARKSRARTTARRAPARRPVRKATYRRAPVRGKRRTSAKRSVSRAPRQQVVRLEIIQAPVAAPNPIAEAMMGSKKEVKPKRARI